MIQQEAPSRPATGRDDEDRWRRWWLIALLVTILVGAGYAIAHRTSGDDAVPTTQPTTPAQGPSAPVSASAPVLEDTVAPASPAAPSLDDVLQLPGTVPAHGPGSFGFSRRTGNVLGSKGPLRRFRVGVESGSGEDVEGFADQVEATLGDARSWIGDGLRLQLVADGQQSDFTVYLATRDTAYRLCRAGGTDDRIEGIPYTSCRTTGKVIINLDRWRLSSKPYVQAKVSLHAYRQYVINHEVGHELGHHHESCPRAGGPAPVMVQQTLTLRGCVPYSWPMIDGHPLTGPSIR